KPEDPDLRRMVEIILKRVQPDESDTGTLRLRRIAGKCPLDRAGHVHRCGSFRIHSPAPGALDPGGYLGLAIISSAGAPAVPGLCRFTTKWQGRTAVSTQQR